MSVATDLNVEVILAVATLSLTMLAVMGEFFHKLVGILYVDSVSHQVKIAHLTFWGNHQDIVLLLEVLCS